MIKNRMIRTSDSKYSSPAFVTRKSNDKLRLLLDYRALNSITLKEEYPFPGIDETLRGLYGRTIFSNIDLNQGYYQIRLNEKLIPYTAFDLQFGRYEFLRIPFGLCIAPKTFQKAVNDSLREYNFEKIYLDDILIASNDIEEYARHLKYFITKLQSAVFSINFEKSRFAQNQVKFLGREISEKGIR